MQPIVALGRANGCRGGKGTDERETWHGTAGARLLYDGSSLVRRFSCRAYPVARRFFAAVAARKTQPTHPSIRAASRIIAACVGRARFVGCGVRERSFRDMIRETCHLARPVFESAAKAVHGGARCMSRSISSMARSESGGPRLRPENTNCRACRQFLDDSDGAWRQRHSMLLLGLDALGRNGPHLRGQVEFVELSA
jgi:hypothetical protein